MRSVFALCVLAAMAASAPLGTLGCGATRHEMSDAAQLDEALLIPCAPNAVLVQVCQQCHSSPMRNGAPFPLVTYSNTQLVIDGEPLYVHMGRALDSDKMPLPPVEISSDDKTVLLEWLTSGAPARADGESCASASR